MNDFVKAIKNNGNKESEEDPSKERYDELKNEEADIEDSTPAEKRYNELKEDAKDELVEGSEAQEEEDSSSNEGFITH